LRSRHPDGLTCQAPSAVTITTCLATDAVIIWRCAEHADAAITEATRHANHAMIMVKPVDHAAGQTSASPHAHANRGPAAAAGRAAAHACLADLAPARPGRPDLAGQGGHHARDQALAQHHCSASAWPVIAG
jgi:hypothetical protein